MINIYRSDSDMWIFIETCSESEISARLAALRLDGNTYRAELQTISGSEILED